MCFHYLRYISKYKQDQETRVHWELVKLQCIKKYYNFHFFHRQDFLLFETLLLFPGCVNLPCCFLTMRVNFSKSNSTKGTGKTAENPFCIGLVPEWHRSTMPSSIATLAGKQLGILCSRNSFQVLNSTSRLFFFFFSSLHLTTKAREGNVVSLFFSGCCCNCPWAHPTSAQVRTDCSMTAYKPNTKLS